METKVDIVLAQGELNSNLAVWACSQCLTVVIGVREAGHRPRGAHELCPFRSNNELLKKTGLSESGLQLWRCA